MTGFESKRQAAQDKMELADAYASAVAATPNQTKGGNMTDREVMQQALEALEFANVNHWWGSLTIEKAITVLRTALAQPPLPEQKHITHITWDERGVRTVNGIPDDAPQQQAEPVSQAVIVGALFDFMGWLTTRDERLVLSGADEAGPAVEAITEFAKMRGLSLDDAKVQDWQNYTTQQQAEPPQRPWVGLTDEERNACLVSADPCEALADPEAKQLMEDIEAKLKERNGY